MRLSFIHGEVITNVLIASMHQNVILVFGEEAYGCENVKPKVMGNSSQIFDPPPIMYTSGPAGAELFQKTELISVG